VVETRLRSDQPKSMEERITKRLQNSGVGKNHQPDQHVQVGTGPTRTHHNVWESGHKVGTPGLPYRKGNDNG
jgi:hypothetical protein